MCDKAVSCAAFDLLLSDTVCRLYLDLEFEYKFNESRDSARMTGVCLQVSSSINQRPVLNGLTIKSCYTFYHIIPFIMLIIYRPICTLICALFQSVLYQFLGEVINILQHKDFTLEGQISPITNFF